MLSHFVADIEKKVLIERSISTQKFTVKLLFYQLSQKKVLIWKRSENENKCFCVLLEVEVI